MKEFIDFLSEHTPYSRLTPEDRSRLAAHVQVEFVPAGTVIVPDGSPPLNCQWVVRNGLVEVVDRGRVVDTLVEGDTFGHVSLLSGLPPEMMVRAVNDTLLYRLPDPREVVSEPAKLVYQHFDAMTTRSRMTSGNSWGDEWRRPVSDLLRPVVWCDASESMAQVAARMSEANQSCAVMELGQDRGIVTDADFRNAVGSGCHVDSTPVGSISSSPARAIDARRSLGEAFFDMLRHSVHHLLVDDGGRAVGVLRAIDISGTEVRQPLVIEAALRSSDTLEGVVETSAVLPSTAVELADLGVPAWRIAGLLAAVRDSIVAKVIELKPAPDVAQIELSWLVMGSQARGECLPSSDIDTAVVWDTVPGADVGEQVRAYCTDVLVDLESCGLKRCSRGGNADNELFSRSVSSWKSASASWIRDPSGAGQLLLANMVADSRPVTHPSLGSKVLDAMLTTTRSQGFLTELLRFTVAPKPPRGFVRDFVVEHSGEHRGELNLKRGGLLPIASLGRWTGIALGDTSGSTVDRVRRAEHEGFLTPDQAQSLEAAYDHVFTMLLDREIGALKAGGPPSPFVRPAELDSLTRRFLRESFRAVAEIQSDLQRKWLARIP
jgi:CBS domain-containing protein